MKSRKSKTPSKTRGKRGPVRDLASRSASVRGGGTLDQLRMQMMLDQQAKADAAASNLLQKMGEAGGTIIDNLK